MPTRTNPLHSLALMTSLLAVASLGACTDLDDDLDDASEDAPAMEAEDPPEAAPGSAGPLEPADAHEDDEELRGVAVGEMIEVEPGIKLPVPRPGTAVAIEVLRDDGDAVTVALVHELDGHVRLRHPDAHLASLSEGTSAACLAKCSDESYSHLFGAGMPASWAGPLVWRYRDADRPSGTKADAIAAIQNASSAVPTSRNSCTMADQVSASQTYDGETTKGPAPKNDGGTIVCDETLLDDAQNVVGWRNLPAPVLGVACVRAVDLGGGNFEITKSDIVFDTSVDWYFGTTEPAGCANDYSLRSVATHEFGHAYGLGHTGQCSQVMAPAVSPCTSTNRHFGRGDVLGLRSLY